MDYIFLKKAVSYFLPKIDFSQWGSIDEKPLTKIQKITGERLQQAWQTIPHVTQFDEADISVLNNPIHRLISFESSKY